jgi:NAD(P)-dependent dehydrogenase (short-subunit alcohol dehydrogenase family)
MAYAEWFERGHVAIVTGASRGFGRAVAGELARLGLKLVIDGRDEAALTRARDELARDTEVVAIRGDVSDAEHVHALVRAAEERFGRIDLVVNNASTIGRAPLPRLDELSPVVFERTFTTNVYAPLHLIQHALPLLRRDGGGTVVTISSDAAVNAYEGWGGYGASKAALDHFSRVLALELHGSGVSVIAADPGDMDTELHAQAVPDADRAALARPELVAPALLEAIASERPSFLRVELQSLPAFTDLGAHAVAEARA